MPAPRRQLCHRIEIGRVDPVGAAVVWDAESAGFGDAAAADMAGSFDQDEFSSGGGDPARRGDARGARPDDHDVEIDGSRCGGA